MTMAQMDFFDLSHRYASLDAQIEYQVRDRLSFMRFLGLGLEGRVSDAKTVWLYREALAQAGMVEALFKQFDGYVARQGYIALRGQFLNASIVAVPRNHNTRDENKAIKSGEVPEDWADKPAKRSQKDTDALWTKKHSKSQCGGYKNHVNLDRKHKLIRRYHVSDGARHDSQAVDHPLMQGNTGSGVWMAAYRSQEMEGKLRDRKLRSHIHRKGKCGKPLTERAKAKIGLKNFDLCPA